VKTFNVFEHPNRGFEAVKVGFSWPAFFFGVLWMIGKKLWALAGLYFILTIVCSFLDAVADRLEPGGGQVIIYLFVMAGSLALCLVPGFKGNKWREENLVGRGYKPVTTVQIETPDAAIAQVTKPA
jgi:hypothetical protein